MKPEEYFKSQLTTNKKRYDALFDFFVNKLSAHQVAEKHKYTVASFYSLIRDFKKYLSEDNLEDFFFKENALGRKSVKNDDLKELIINLRKQNFSIEEIVSFAQSKSYKVSYFYVYQMLIKEGFSRLQRRTVSEKKELEPPVITAPVTQKLDLKPEKFQSSNTGLLVFLPIIYKYGIHSMIERCNFPFTKTVNRLSSILCFLALKLSGVKRYSHDNIWCMDRGLGLFAGLTVLPKASWFSSYSSRVEPQMNLSFLKEMHKLWEKHGLLGDTTNLDFTTIPYWGESDHLENNWSGKRGKAMSSMLAVLAQSPDNGIIDYGNCDVMHKNESAVVLESLDFYRSNTKENDNLKYLIFDSKFTNYQNLAKLDDEDIKFITIRRRGGKMLEDIKSIRNWKRIRVEASGLKKRTLNISEQIVSLQGYKDEKTGKSKKIRQIIITGHGKIKPAIILTNDFDLPIDKIVRKYCRRWLVEKGISEQIDFFHLNRVSSSMVIKVDFDMVMTILAHNLYRLMAQEFERYKNLSNERIYQKFIDNSGSISIEPNTISISLKKKRELPQVIDFTKKYSEVKFHWLDNKKLNFVPSASS
jgi:IS30 family transposase